MSKGIVRLSCVVLYFTGVFSIMIEPSPTARFRRYTSNRINCSVDPNWTNVIFNMLPAINGTTIAFFTLDVDDCKDNIPPNELYKKGCDFSSRIFYLIITNVTDFFSNRTLTCVANYKTPTSSNSAMTTIDVQYPPTESPSITQMPEAPVIEGNTTVLSCKIPGGNPLGTISWKCDGFTTVTTTAAKDGVVSRVESVVTKGDNNKECTCVGHHLFWTENKETKYTLIVYYLPTVTISPVRSPYKVIENKGKFSFTCSVIDANPNITTYKWYKDGNEISTVTTYVFTIFPVNRSHTGNYTCDAANIVGSSKRSSAVQLTVLYGIELNPISKTKPIEGTKLNITCSGQSYPAMTDDDAKWTKQNDEKIIMQGQYLVIDPVNRIDSGTYVCSVVVQLKPTVGTPANVTGTTHVEVDVSYLPTVTIFPVRSIFNVLENTTSFNFTCSVTDANPNVTSYTWYKNDDMISAVATYVYTIYQINRLHTGSYTCDAQNVAGRSNRSAALQLNVLYGIEMIQINKNEPTEGTVLNITCSGHSYPVITDDNVKWTKQNNNTFNDRGKHLVIDNVNRKDKGTFVCSVMIQLKPTIGVPITVSGIATVEIDVFYKPTVRVSPEFNPNFVTENSTNLRITCNVTDANPTVLSYRWNIDGALIQSAATFVITKVQRSHSGSYVCYANNSVGSSDASPVFQLNVLYGVSLKLSQTEISVNESESWDLFCIGDGNPIPKITCANKYNSSVVGEQKGNTTAISIDHANCMDTGIYTCAGNNAIGESVSLSADVEVACKPRTYNNMDKQDIFINGTDESLNISTTFISFPLSIMSWSRELPNGNWTELENEFNTSNIPTQLPFEQISLLQKARLESNQFGIYLLRASNIHGSFLLTYNVISKRAPDPPTNVTANCDITSIRVTWISRFNGGENQTFRIYFVNNLSNQTSYKDDIADKGKDKTNTDQKESLNPDTLYIIFLEAYNLYGRTESKDTANCTTKINQVENQVVSSALVGGIAGSISALLVVVVVIGVLYFWRRRQVNGGDNKLIKRQSKDKDEDEDGLKTNPLYVTSGEVSNAEVGPVYGVVNKKRQKKESMTLDENNDQGPVYSQVQKPSTQEKKKGKDKKAKKTPRNENYKDIELGTVYENSDKLSKLHSSDELYANAGEQGKGVNLAKGYNPKKNKDGLIYADLDLVPGPNGRKFVIRGIENKTNYAMIDLSIKVDPLPSDDDDEEDKDSEKAKSAPNECNE